MKPIGEFEEAVHELHRSYHALMEAIAELARYADGGDYAGLHLTQALSAIQLTEERISVAKRKLESHAGKALFSNPHSK